MRLFSAVAVTAFLFSGCLTYKWEAMTREPDVSPAKGATEDTSTKQSANLETQCKEADGEWNAKRQLCRDVRFTTSVGVGQKAACFLTAILYVGWCWFITPFEEDYMAAKKSAKMRLGADALVEYRGRE